LRQETVEVVERQVVAVRGAWIVLLSWLFVEVKGRTSAVVRVAIGGAAVALSAINCELVKGRTRRWGEVG